MAFLGIIKMTACTAGGQLVISFVYHLNSRRTIAGLAFLANWTPAAQATCNSPFRDVFRRTSKRIHHWFGNRRYTNMKNMDRKMILFFIHYFVHIKFITQINKSKMFRKTLNTYKRIFGTGVTISCYPLR